MIFDCLKGLIGFCKSNECLGEAPVDMRYDPASGIYLDRHTVFKAAIITEQTNFFGSSNWGNIADADFETRQQLGLDLLKIIRSKVDPTFDTRTVEIGENRGGGYHSTYTVPIIVPIRTKSITDAVFYITHIGVRALVLSGGFATVNISLKKNGTVLETWERTITNLMDSRQALDVPYPILLDGSVYSFEYSYPANVYPVKNPLDCGCPTIQNGYNCFFHDFDGDAGGLRILGEIRCNQMDWPCSAVRTELSGLASANAYRTLLVTTLLKNLITARQGKPNAFTILKPDDLGPMLENLQAEYGTYLQAFADNYSPSASCCFEFKSFSTVVSGL